MSDTVPNLIAETQAKYNRSTREHWDHFTDHRKKVFDLLVPDGLSTGGRLCVLGAGNCNDLELRQLLDVFHSVSLVDIDGDAITRAAKRQNVAGHAQLHLHGGIDLTAIAHNIAFWPKAAPTNRQLDDVLKSLETAPMPHVGGPFDVILSPCILSQICLFAEDTLGKRHPRRLDLRQAIRKRHVRQLVEWLRPGGSGLLVTDLVTTRKLGSLLETHHDRLDDVVRKVVSQAGHFAGLDPASMRSAFLDDPLLAGLVSNVSMISPWRWTLGPAKAFLVYAMRFRRSLGTTLLNPHDHSS